MANSERVTVTDAATAMNASRTAPGSVGQRLHLLNRDGTNSVDLGGAGVTSAAGYELAAGQGVTVDVAANEVLFAIAPATVTVRVDVLRTG